MKTKVITLDNKAAGEITLSEDVFAAPVRKDILARMVNWQLAKRRAGTHKMKGRSEVSGTTAKQFRQKGTGRARRGSGKVSQFRSGGRAFGPTPRSHEHKLPKKLRKMAMRSALSSKQADGELIILNQAVLTSPKTKELSAKLDKLGWTSVLVVSGTEIDDNFALAARNVPNLDVLPSEGANVYDILRHQTLVLTRDAVETLEGRLK